MNRFCLPTVRLGKINLLTVLLFLLYLPLISKVNFMQNDGWNRVTSVDRFLHGDFTLIPHTATTFYSQGFLGLMFARVFGVAQLPILTLAVSALCLNVFLRILSENFSLSKLPNLLVGLIVFFNPLFQYSMIGFMTENYLLLYFLLGLYFFLRFNRMPLLKYLFLADVFSLLAMLAKQSGLILIPASSLYFLIKKKYKTAVIQLLLVLLVLGTYYFVFPMTNEMQSKGFVFKHIFDFSYSYSLVYGSLLVIMSFTLPLCVYFIVSTIVKFKFSPLVLVFMLVVSSILYVTLNAAYKPGKISWEEYPYFENTFERTGFLPRTVMGTKYQFRFNYDIYHYWELFSKVVMCLLIVCVVVQIKRAVNIYFWIISGYLLLMVFTEIFFDRYLLLLVPVFVLFLLEMQPRMNRLSNELTFNLIAVPFVLFLGILSTQMAADFILDHHYIWERSRLLVSNGVPPREICATGAWKRLYGDSQDCQYLFSYDSPKANPELSESYEVIEVKEIEYPLDWFIDPRVYLYKKKY